MPLEGPARIVSELTSRGYNAEREAVTRIAAAENPEALLERVVEELPADALVVRTDHVDSALERTGPVGGGDDDAGDGSDDRVGATASGGATTGRDDGAGGGSGEGDDHDAGARSHPSVSTGTEAPTAGESSDRSPVETEGSGNGAGRSVDPDLRSLEIDGDMTGESTGTGAYEDFVAVFRDRLERLGSSLRSRINHRPATAIQSMPGGSEVGMVGLVNDVRSTASGHWLIELEDATGTFPWLVMKDREYVDLVDELLRDEVLAMEGTLSDDAGIAFVDSMHFPDVPRTHQPSTADRHVQAALISDVHVGSEEFMADAWSRFADWLSTAEAQHVEYLLIAGDMVEGVGIYPDQDEELEIVDIYEQYEAFNEYLKEVPGDVEIVMIPGNHDAVRLAEPQPGFDEDLREIMSAHDARIVSNPSTVTLEGVSVLLYHGVSLDEVIAELPEEKASYDEPHKAMYQLLKKRHVAPQFGGHTRLAPEEKDYLVIDEVPDIFHTGHVHKLGFGKYHNVLAINSGCWQAQTDFQKSVNIDPDSGYAPIVDLDTLDVTVQKFS
ncbi:DNA-directed DNA polymerase II small subunit [Natrarchaeobius oligotrophus]|uniref:DNA polymerase II small subunit n=1 Tax=Natrarchaeobius chitinivorans TaxID=1679083 RepID=A0A3N6MB56_NATCH|nr:DNA-directed DNA polymerase II small subunit [Natrarchaeobius chitinivorans]RQH01019.1 DNA-directed DNA polymerase II small subunit [Natrarchaeobius chitinivorans]